MKSGFEEKDLELFKKVKSRDREAFKLFIRKYQDKVFGLCYSYLYDRYKAEDKAQETFIRFYEKVHTIRKPESFISFIFKIAHNLCMDQLKKNGREEVVSPLSEKNDTHKTIHDYLEPIEDTPESILIEREQQERRIYLRTLVNKKMKKLNPDQRAAIYLIHFKKFPYRKATEILDCSEGTVKSRVNRGIKKLGELVKNK